MTEMNFNRSAKWGARAMAFIIDLVLLGAFHFILFILVTARLIQALFIDPEVILTFFALYPLFISIGFLFLHMFYFTLFHAWSGQTIGKMIMGIKVVGNGNEPASPGVSFLRWCGYILSIIPLATGFLWAAVDKDHCAWHDILARTRVVSAEMT